MSLTSEYGLSIISNFVALSPTPSLSVIIFASCKRFNDLASFVTSFGTAILSPSESVKVSLLPEYIPNGS